MRAHHARRIICRAVDAARLVVFLYYATLGASLGDLYARVQCDRFLANTAARLESVRVSRDVSSRSDVVATDTLYTRESVRR